jgi:hypothetical protein
MNTEQYRRNPNLQEYILVETEAMAIRRLINGLDLIDRCISRNRYQSWRKAYSISLVSIPSSRNLAANKSARCRS